MLTRNCGRSALLLIALLCAAPVLAQVRDRTVQAKTESDAAILARGWTALAQDKPQDADRAAGEVLARLPWNHAALDLRIEALAAVNPGRGLDVYDRWLRIGQPEDLGLLEPIARGVLLDAANSTDPVVQRDALRALADARVAGAAERLAALKADTADRLAAEAAAARGGDTGAMQRLATAATSATLPHRLVAQALAQAGAEGVPALMGLLNDPDFQTRAAAAKALGKMKIDMATPALQRALQDPDPTVRTSAAVSLAQLGDQNGQALVDRMLASGIPDVQLAAVDAWDGQPGPWVDVVRGLLDNRDGMVRLEAARAIAPVDPDAARKVLGEAMQDPNPAIRAESATALTKLVGAQPRAADIPALRKALRDADPHVRVASADALLRLARG